MISNYSMVIQIQQFFEKEIVKSTSHIVDINSNMVNVAIDINDTVAIINGFDLNDTKNIKVSYQPSQMDIDSNNNSQFITHGDNDTITFINLINNKIVTLQ